jgi:hypothetical protein
MKSNSSEPKSYFCTLPWTGLFSVETNLDVTFCPCFLKMKIGNLAKLRSMRFGMPKAARPQAVFQ